jgi:hypothetical protein
MGSIRGGDEIMRRELLALFKETRLKGAGFLLRSHG